MTDVLVRGARHRPREARLVGHQARHDVVALLREPVAVFFALAFPLLFFTLVAALVGNETLDERSGVRVAQFMMPALASFGLVMATFSTLAIGLAQDREDGVLKRLRGTPLGSARVLAARVVSGAVLAVASVALLVVVAVAFYRVQVVWRTLPATLLTLAVGTLCFSALGLAVAAVSPSPQAAMAATNGLIIPLSFVSDVFGIGSDRMPQWLDAVGWFFPLRHLVAALGDATNPFLTGSGLYADHLAVLGLWGAFGALVAVRRLSVEPRVHRTASTGTAPHEVAGRPDRARHGVPGRRPGLARLLVGEIRHADSLLWRDPGSTFFAVAFPLLLVLLVPQIYGRDSLLADGTPLPRFYAAVMSVYGAAVTAYVNMPEELARARERGVLQRLAGTPLPLAVAVLGRVLSSVWVAAVTVAGVFVVAGALYDVPVPVTWPGVVVTVLLTVTCFAVLGVVLVTLLRSSRSVTAVALGTLLPLSFVSDIFVVGADFPAVLDAIGWATPLRHATRAMSDAYAVGATGSGLEWEHLGVIAAWLVAGLTVVLVQVRRGALAAGRT